MSSTAIEKVVGDSDKFLSPTELIALQKLSDTSQESKLQLIDELEIKYDIYPTISSIKRVRRTPEAIIDYVNTNYNPEDIALFQLYAGLRGGRVAISGIFTAETLDAINKLSSPSEFNMYAALQKEYSRIRPLSSGNIIVESGKQTGVLNPDRKTYLIPLGTYDEIRYAEYGHYTLSKNGQTGLLKPNGRDFWIPLNTTYRGYTVQVNKTIEVQSQKDSTRGLLAADGQTVIIPTGKFLDIHGRGLSSISVLSSGLIFVRFVNELMCGSGAVGLVDESGKKMLVHPITGYSNIDDRGDHIVFRGTASCGGGGYSYGVFDVGKRKLVASVDGYDSIKKLSGGYFEVKKGEFIGLLDPSGSLIVDPSARYTSVTVGANGNITLQHETNGFKSIQKDTAFPSIEKKLGKSSYRFAVLNGKYGVIDPSGNIVIPTVYDKMEYTANGMVIGYRGNTKVLLSATGGVVDQGEEISIKYWGVGDAMMVYLVKKGGKYTFYWGFEWDSGKKPKSTFSVEAEDVDIPMEDRSLQAKGDIIGFKLNGFVTYYSITKGIPLTKAIPENRISSIKQRYQGGPLEIITSDAATGNKKGLILGDQEVLLPGFDDIYVASYSTYYYTLVVSSGNKSGLIRLKMGKDGIDAKVVDSLGASSLKSLLTKAQSMASYYVSRGKNPYATSHRDISIGEDIERLFDKGRWYDNYDDYEPNNLDPNTILKESQMTLMPVMSQVNKRLVSSKINGTEPTTQAQVIKPTSVSVDRQSGGEVVDTLTQGKSILKEVLVLINGENLDKLKIKERIAAYEKLGLGTARIRVTMSGIRKLMTEDNIATELGTGNFEYVDGEKGKISISALKKYL